jgi:hypothetical protein
MKLLANNIKEYWVYFLYYPDKTNVILQIYFFNPLFNIIEKVLNFIVNNIRKFLLILISVFSKG